MPVAPLNPLDRRTLLKSLVAGGLAAALAPGTAEAAWRAVAAASKSVGAAFLDSDDTRLIVALADTILPRTDTPGAVDLGVVPWIDTVVAGYFTEAQRTQFHAGLAAIEDYSRLTVGAPLETLSSGVRAGIVTFLDAGCGIKAPTPAQHAYVQLKELILYGYFTSEIVQKELLHVVVVPGRYDPSVPLEATPAK